MEASVGRVSDAGSWWAVAAVRDHVEDPRPTRVAETHISRLFFVGDRVVKVKRPIVTAFADFSTLDARRRACEREVELNRRLAEDVYLGVMDMALEGETVEHAVVMVRLPEERRLSARLDSPSVLDDLHGIAARVASLHATARRAPEIDRTATRDAVRDLWRSGVDQLRPFAGDLLEPDAIERMAVLADEYLSGREPLFEERIAKGAACDGHGDLQAEDIFCLDDGPRILDCLEFDDRLRYGDVLADVAFLAMDLGRLGHPELGARFLTDYRDLTAEDWPDTLAHHYMAYRAHVRSKVACLRAAGGDATAVGAARALHEVAVDHLESARVLMVLVGGTPGTGKTTVARELADRLGATRWSTDEVRDGLLPRGRDDAGTSAPGISTGRYAPHAVDEVYAATLQRAGERMSMGGHVVLDASWLHLRHRTAARELARRAGAVLVELRCTCPAEVAEQRIQARARAGLDASEATVEVARALAASTDPWPEARAIDTGRTVGHAVSAAIAHLERRVQS